MSDFKNLGREVGAAQDADIEARRLVEEARAATRGGLRRRSRKSRWVALTPLAAAAALVLALAAAWVWRMGHRSISLEGETLTSGAWVVTTQERPLRFSDGATVLVGPETRFQVASLGSAGAAMQVARGRLSVSVPHRPDTQWSFAMGPFTVHVVGTRFDTSWDPDSQTFSLRMHDGAVLLDGPNVPERRQVVAGQRLELTLEQAPSPPVTPALATEPVGVEPQPKPPKPVPPQVAPGWKTLAHSGKYAEALAVAEAQGWPRQGALAPAEEVLLFGDVARLAGALAQADEAYRRALARFPSTAEAAAAMFSLGRLAFERGARDEAIDWFIRYRTQQPEGPFAAEALGRLIELYGKNDPAKARAAAELYLTRYPTGGHRRVAQGVLDE